MIILGVYVYADAPNTTCISSFFCTQSTSLRKSYNKIRGLPYYLSTTCSSPSPSSEPKSFFPYALHSLYQIPGTIANFFALYLPPNSFLYLRSFFLAQTAICPTAIAMKSAVLQCLLTIKIAIQAIDSKV